MTRFVILSEPGRRAAGFSAAVEAAGLKPPSFVSYAEFLRAPAQLAKAIRHADVLRIDSPGGGFDSWRLFAALGGQDVSNVKESIRRIEPPLPCHRGFGMALKHASEVARAASVAQLVDPVAVETLYDKPLCSEQMRQAGLPVPTALPEITCFEDLRSTMQARGLMRAFVKLRYGSGGSGVAAVEFFGKRLRAWSATETSDDGAMYNVPHVRRLLDGDAVRLIDALAQYGVHSEHWIAKLRLSDQACDLRLLVIGGEPAHAVVRLSASPITNLHLKNRRAPAEFLRSQIPGETWERILDVGKQAAAMFPAHFCIALDIAVHEDRRQIFVLEGNAFGDELRGVTFNGLDPYAFQVARVRDWVERRRAA